MISLIFTIIIGSIIWFFNIPLFVIQVISVVLSIYCIISTRAIRVMMRRYLSIDPKKLKKRHGYLEYCIVKAKDDYDYREMLLYFSPVFIYSGTSMLIMRVIGITFFILVIFSVIELIQSFSWVVLIASLVCGYVLMTVITPFNKDAPPRRFVAKVDKAEKTQALAKYNEFFTEKEKIAKEQKWETREYFFPTP